jgi:hypothetical protein
MNLIKTEPVLCIDPGTTHSGVVIFDGLNITRIEKDWENNDLVKYMEGGSEDVADMAIEGVASYGMAVGATTFETVEWIGRFRQAHGFRHTTRIFRKDIKMFLCQSMRAKDKNIRQRILDIFPATGGGKTPQVGTKGQPGPLYGVSSHAFSALAIGLTYKYGLTP